MQHSTFGLFDPYRRMNRGQTEDLKAFEQRLMDTVAYARGNSIKWKVVIAISLLWFGVSLYIWWTDSTDYENYLDMFSANKNLCVSAAVLFLIYLLGFFDRQNAANIITNRCRSVLHDFNMSCDDQGKLILKRPKLPQDPWKHS